MADLLLVAGGSPASDLSLLHAPASCDHAGGGGGGARGVMAVFKEGLMVKGCVRPELGAGGGGRALSLNEALFEAPAAPL